MDSFIFGVCCHEITSPFFALRPVVKDIFNKQVFLQVIVCGSVP